MFNDQLPKFAWAPLKLDEFPSFEEKLIALKDYNRITAIFCDIANKDSFQNERIPEEILYVRAIAIPPWQTSYAKTILTERLAALTVDAKEYTQCEDSFENISNTLQRCVELCENEQNKNNLDNSFTSDHHLKFYVHKEGHFYKYPLQCLSFESGALYDLEEHFSIRKGFYEQMVVMLSKVLNLHKEKTQLNKYPYKWDSKKAELEISELLFVLQILAQRIKIDSSTDASFSKFRRDFFELFGLKDDNYDKKLLQIRNRKLKSSFMGELAECIKKYLSGLK